MWRLTDAQRELREHIRTVVLDEIRPATLDMGETDEYPQDVFDVLAREGLLRLGIPHEHGGRADESDVSFCTYVEELAKISAHRLADGRLREARVAADHPRRHRGAEGSAGCRGWRPARSTAPTRSPSPASGRIPPR